MKENMAEQSDDNDPGEGPSISNKGRIEHLMNKGREHYIDGHFDLAAVQLGNALTLSAEEYGVMASECFEPYFLYAKTLLDWYRCVPCIFQNNMVDEEQLVMDELHKHIEEEKIRFQSDEKWKRVDDGQNGTNAEWVNTVKNDSDVFKREQRGRNVKGSCGSEALEEDERHKLNEESEEISEQQTQKTSEISSTAFNEKNDRMEKVSNLHEEKEDMNGNEDSSSKISSETKEGDGQEVAVGVEVGELKDPSWQRDGVDVLSESDNSAESTDGLKKCAEEPNGFSSNAKDPDELKHYEENSRTNLEIYVGDMNVVGGRGQDKEVEIELRDFKEGMIKNDGGTTYEEGDEGVLDEDCGGESVEGEDDDITLTNEDEPDRMELAWKTLQDALLICENHIDGEGWKEKKADALLVLAEWHMEDGSYKEAISNIISSIALYSDQCDRRIAAAYYELARAYRLDGQSDKMARSQKKAAQVLIDRLELIKKESAEATGDRKVAALSEIDDLKQIITEIDPHYNDSPGISGIHLQVDEEKSHGVKECNGASKRSAGNRGDDTEREQKKAKIVEEQTLEHH